ncbi:MAG: peptidoglycan editing factor PgeF [Gammaproteobacteria bacterium]|nr:MAG: peptidoglycan editing factor PgeF [Gammaproteobacteria bacterium]
MSIERWIVPDWPVPAHVRAFTTTRQGGMSQGPYAHMNLADHVGDDPAAVAQNRKLLQQQLGLPGEPLWLQQVHGNTPVNALECGAAPVADASWCRQAGVVCAVLTADCLPLLMCDRRGETIAAVHAGWRGLAAGIIEQTVRRMQIPAENLLAWMGPAIGPQAYQVGDEVRDAFVSHQDQAGLAFQSTAEGWKADLYLLARQRLAECGVTAVYGGNHCTFREHENFFSFRRDGRTGRMASLIWLETN